MVLVLLRRVLPPPAHSASSPHQPAPAGFPPEGNTRTQAVMSGKHFWLQCHSPLPGCSHPWATEASAQQGFLLPWEAHDGRQEIWPKGLLLQGHHSRIGMAGSVGGPLTLRLLLPPQQPGDAHSLLTAPSQSDLSREHQQINPLWFRESGPGPSGPGYAGWAWGSALDTQGCCARHRGDCSRREVALKAGSASDGARPARLATPTSAHPQ